MNDNYLNLFVTTQVRQPSTEDGVTFVLNVFPQDYSGITLGNGYGYYVSIYNPKQATGDDNSRISLALGTHSFVSLEKRVKKILQRPYADEDCSDVSENDDDYRTHRACIVKCREKLLFNGGVDFLTGSQCSCDPHALSGDSQCTLFDLYFCLYPYVLEYDSSILRKECDCPYACTESTYDYSISSTQFANEYVEGVAYQNNWQFTNASAIQQNYLSAQFYFRSLTETVVAEIPEMKIVDMFGNIGGQLGLCVGASLITFAEFFEFLAVAIVKTCKARRKQRATMLQVKPAPGDILGDQ